MVQYAQENTDKDTQDTEERTPDWEPCPECGTPLVEHSEMRGEVGFWELISECPGCGYTDSD